MMKNTRLSHLHRTLKEWKDCKMGFYVKTQVEISNVELQSLIKIKETAKLLNVTVEKVRWLAKQNKLISLCNNPYIFSYEQVLKYKEKL
ncbi:hypothetical protein UFOVP338_54 [uncultured Caudovirales phage]|uniref:Helix-turn-helix domain containing protein n=1 Tax=uncultured Caudovirales phage TaxID=2100421 RepID=A0A6J5LZU7_9CAUD|nr:hypothetical protein UFOVP338_54 [uncultured Caudovirales phage]